MNTLQTKRLTLCPITINESAFIFELLNTPDWIKFIGDRNIRTLADARDYIADKLIKGYQEDGFGLLLVKLQNNEAPIGICGLIKREALADIDIGFAFLPQFYGKGYAYEAAAATMDDARMNRGIKRIVAITTEVNLRSIRLLEKIGLHFEKRFYMEGDPEELLLYS